MNKVKCAPPTRPLTPARPPPTSAGLIVEVPGIVVVEALSPSEEVLLLSPAQEAAVVAELNQAAAVLDVAGGTVGSVLQGALLTAQDAINQILG